MFVMPLDETISITNAQVRRTARKMKAECTLKLPEETSPCISSRKSGIRLHKDIRLHDYATFLGWSQFINIESDRLEFSHFVRDWRQVNGSR